MAQQHEEQQPGCQYFRIWVQGRLDEHFSDGLAGIEQEDVPAGTMLHGEMLDRSQLHGTLDLLRSLGIDVLRLEVDPPRIPEGADIDGPGEGSSRGDGAPSLAGSDQKTQ